MLTVILVKSFNIKHSTCYTSWGIFFAVVIQATYSYIFLTRDSIHFRAITVYYIGQLNVHTTTWFHPYT